MLQMRMRRHPQSRPPVPLGLPLRSQRVSRPHHPVRHLRRGVLMTCKCCTEAAKAVELALDDEELYRRLAALKSFEDCDALIEQLVAAENAHYGEYLARE